MSIDTLKSQMPDYAKDIKLNLSSLANEEVLNDQQKWGTFLVSALAARNADVIAEIDEEAKVILSESAYQAAKAAAAIMAMNNVYYKFTGFMSEGEYRNMPAKLRMNVIGKPGVEMADFELWSLAVSAVNGCKYCILAHEKKLRQEGVSAEQIQAAVRIAAVVHAAAAALEGEQALSNASEQKAAA